jgi:hypothetical protein
LDWDVGFPDSLTALLIAVVCVVVLALAWFFVLPALVLVVDVLLLLLIAGLGVLARVFLRRPWVIEAESSERRYEWGVVGWRAARREVDEAVQWLANGGSLEHFRPGLTGRRLR